MAEWVCLFLNLAHIIPGTYDRDVTSRRNNTQTAILIHFDS